MPNIGGPELIIVLVIFILLFGAKKLPDLGSSVGKSIKNFKKGLNEEEKAAAEARAEADARAQAELPQSTPDVPPATQTSRHEQS